MANEKKKTTATTDPLEAAKIASKPPPPPAPTPPAPPELHLPTGTIEPAAPPMQKWQVAVTTTVSLDGQLVKLPQGAILSAQEYGPRGMAQIIAANVALVEIK